MQLCSTGLHGSTELRCVAGINDDVDVSMTWGFEDSVPEEFFLIFRVKLSQALVPECVAKGSRFTFWGSGG